MYLFNVFKTAGVRDSVAEWLRRWIANPLLSERVGSNPTTVVTLLLKFEKHISAIMLTFINYLSNTLG